MPTVTRLPLEAHPFSYANVPSQLNGSPTFLIRVHNDATKLLRDSLGSDECALLPIRMEGPYGTVPQLDQFSTVVLFAGACSRCLIAHRRWDRDRIFFGSPAFPPRPHGTTKENSTGALGLAYEERADYRMDQAVTRQHLRVSERPGGYRGGDRYLRHKAV